MPTALGLNRCTPVIDKCTRENRKSKTYVEGKTYTVSSTLQHGALWSMAEERFARYSTVLS